MKKERVLQFLSISSDNLGIQWPRHPELTRLDLISDASDPHFRDKLICGNYISRLAANLFIFISFQNKSSSVLKCLGQILNDYLI